MANQRRPVTFWGAFGAVILANVVVGTGWALVAGAAALVGARAMVKEGLQAPKPPEGIEP